MTAGRVSAPATGSELIAAERQRQIEVEGYTAEHDDLHKVHSFVLAAIAYLGKGPWPWSRESFKFSDRDGYYHERDLVKAGALIAAAIDRLQAGQRDA